MHTRIARTAMAALFFAAMSHMTASAAAEPGGSSAAKTVVEKVVYHVDDMASAREALFNIENHLAASPKAKISLLANGKGIYLLVAGEKDKFGEYATTLQRLASQGVRFLACNNSMKNRNIQTGDLVPDTQVVPAGVVELTRLQLAEQYAYIKP